MYGMSSFLATPAGFFEPCERPMHDDAISKVNVKNPILLKCIILFCSNKLADDALPHEIGDRFLAMCLFW